MAIIKRNVRFQEEHQEAADASAPRNASIAGKDVAPFRLRPSLTGLQTVGEFFREIQ